MQLELRIVGLLFENVQKQFTINEIAHTLDEYYSFVHRIVGRLVADGAIVRNKIGNSYLCSLNTKSEKARALIQLNEIEKKNVLYSSNKELALVLEDVVKSAMYETGMISAVLFGSYAKGTETQVSDIDILLLCRRKKGVDKLSREIYAKYGKEINIIAMTPIEFRKQKGKAVIREIINIHYIIYGVEKFVDVVIG